MDRITSIQSTKVQLSGFLISKKMRKMELKKRHHPIMGTKILVVEDNELNQKVARLMLEDKRYEVKIAATGVEALFEYKANQYDAILMDIGLPDISGIEVTKRIRSCERMTGRHIPIIAVTAHGKQYHSECLSAGMDAFTAKPIMMDELTRVINQLLKKPSKVK